MSAVKNDLSFHNLSVEDAVELSLDGHSGGYWQQALNWCKLNNDDDDFNVCLMCGVFDSKSVDCVVVPDI